MREKKKTIAVIGATGAVGREIVRLLLERKFPGHLRLFASKKSIGRIVYGHPVEPLENLQGIDLAFFAAGSHLSKQWIPQTSCLCIDSSSAFRETEPLIIPEINPHAVKNSRILCSPNCTATVLLLPLFPLHRKFGVKRAIVSTYQAASGGGEKLVSELQKETRAHLDQLHYNPLLGFPYAFNLYPHNSSLDPLGYVDEERKIAFETCKILEDPSIRLSATCVRVPVLRAHSVSANVEFHKSFTLQEVYAELDNIPGLRVFEDRANNRFATPFDATHQHEVLAGRFRLDATQPNTLEFWAVGDQLLKGAALNAVQIAELIDKDRIL